MKKTKKEAYFNAKGKKHMGEDGNVIQKQGGLRCLKKDSPRRATIEYLFRIVRIKGETTLEAILLND